MTATEIRQQLMREIAHIPDDRLGEVFDFLHYFRLGLESSACPERPVVRRRPSPKLAGKGARFLGDDVAPAIPLEDWGSLYQDAK